MNEQTSIPKNKIGRAASLVSAGAKVGVNYLKYRGKKLLTGEDDKDTFHKRTAADTYSAFSKLKGGPLKLAQMLSMDRNMIPAQYADEFSKAQYQAPPLSYPLVVRTFQSELGKSPSEMFDTFSQQAAAGASIGQVHKATIGDQTFAVKVQYPGVADALSSDLAIVKPIAMRLFQLDAAAINPYLKEVEERLLEETDYVLEMERSIQLAEDSAMLPNTRFPRYFKQLSSSRIITMEWLNGAQIDKFAASDAPQALKNTIAQALWDFYAHQIHRLRLFHADPHPGNFLVEGNDLCVLDFGCVKSIAPSFYQDYFAMVAPSLSLDHDNLLTALRKVNLILPEDSPTTVDKLLDVFKESILLLNRPIHSRTFDFSDASYFQELADFGERCRLDAELQSINQGRGKPDALYLNRTFFGLYNLMHALNAMVKTDTHLEAILSGSTAA